MFEKHFIVNRQKLPNRCEICHQTDCFDVTLQVCSRYQPLLWSRFSISDRPSNEIPLVLEIIEQTTFSQGCLLLLLCGVTIGIFMDLPKIALDIVVAYSLSISLLGMIPFFFLRPTKNFHPLLNGMLVTLMMIPLGWVLLGLVYWVLSVVLH